MKRGLFIAVSLLSLAVKLCSNAAAETHVSLRPVLDAPKDSEKISVTINGTKEDLLVQKHPLLNEKQFRLAEVTLVPEHLAAGPTLEIPLTADGQTKLREWSQANVGHKLALFVDGKFISAPMVVETLESPSFRVFGLEREQVLALYKDFTGAKQIPAGF